MPEGRQAEQEGAENPSLRDTVQERLEQIAAPVARSLERPVARVTGWAEWVRALRPMRVYTQYSYSDGNLRAAGMSYQSLFAAFAAIWLTFSVAGIWLQARPDVLTALVNIIDTAIPGLIGENGVISIDAVSSLAVSFGWTSIVAAAGLLWTAIAWLYYTRQAVRAMFGLGRDQRNYVVQKIVDLGLALAFGILLLLAAVLSVASTEALDFLLSLAGIDQRSFWAVTTTRVVGLLLVVAVNMIALGAMFRILSRVSIPLRNLAVGTLLGGIALGGLSTLSGYLLGGASKNPLFASFAVFVGLLLWFNLVCRAILLSAAWIAVGMSDRGLSPRRLTPEQRELEQEEREHDARVFVARRELDRALAEAREAHGMRRWSRNRRVRAARSELNRLKAQDPDGAPQTEDARTRQKST